MKRSHAALAATLMLALAGCATLSEDACRGGDWERIGLRDGAQGRAPDFIAQHARACADYGIVPDQAAWLRGREAGLKLYCTPRNAFEVGADGRVLNDVCPLADASILRQANRDGLAWHRTLSDIREAERRIDQIDAALASLPDGDPARAGLVSERAALRLELISLRLERPRRRY